MTVGTNNSVTIAGNATFDALGGSSAPTAGGDTLVGGSGVEFVIGGGAASTAGNFSNNASITSFLNPTGATSNAGVTNAATAAATLARGGVDSAAAALTSTTSAQRVGDSVPGTAVSIDANGNFISGGGGGGGAAADEASAETQGRLNGGPSLRPRQMWTADDTWQSKISNPVVRWQMASGYKNQSDLEKIARRNNVTVADIQALNPNMAPNKPLLVPIRDNVNSTGTVRVPKWVKEFLAKNGGPTDPTLGGGGSTGSISGQASAQPAAATSAPAGGGPANAASTLANIQNMNLSAMNASQLSSLLGTLTAMRDSSSTNRDDRTQAPANHANHAGHAGHH